MLADFHQSPCSDEGLTLETSANILFTLYGVQYIHINLKLIHCSARFVVQGQVAVCFGCFCLPLIKSPKALF